MLSTPPPDEPADAAALRGRIFTDLDLLAFSLELEAARLVQEGRDDEAVHCQERRLGVRLAQRMVSGVWADEVNLRMQAAADEYVARFPQGCAPRVDEADQTGQEAEMGEEAVVEGVDSDAVPAVAA